MSDLHWQPMKRAGLACTAIGLIGAFAVPMLSAADGGPVFSDPLLKDRHTVDVNAAKRIGEDYACAVVTASPDDQTRAIRLLVIYVTSRDAVTRAEHVRQGLDHPDQAAVQLVNKRLRASVMRRILRRARKTAPNGVGSGIGEGLVYHRRCPRVELIIKVRGEASDEAERLHEALPASLRGRPGGRTPPPSRGPGITSGRWAWKRIRIR